MNRQGWLSEEQAHAIAGAFLRIKDQYDSLHPRELWHAKWPTLAGDLGLLISEVDRLYDLSLAQATLLRDAGLVLFNMPKVTDEHWYQQAKAVMNRIDDSLPGGIP
jgi:hypothetical protein